VQAELKKTLWPETFSKDLGLVIGS
jgi:hypothetical protein